MPYTTIGIPAPAKRIAAELREMYGGMMTLADIGRELGYTDWRPIQNWAADLPSVTVSNGTRKKRKYRVNDVAKKIYTNMEGPT